MGRDGDRQSRFGPPNTYKSSNSAVPLMSLKSGMARNSYGDNIFPTQNFGSSMPNYKTPEQLAFDSEFKKWEKSFEDWKRAYANHPDRVAYREYEKKFLDVREKLMEKRKQIYNEGPGPATNSFDNFLSAADAMANSILSKFGDAPPQKDFRDDDQYRGGYSRGNNRDEMYGQGKSGSYGRNDSYGGRSGSFDRNFGTNDRSFAGNDRSFGGNDRSFAGNDRSFGGNNRSFGSNDRNFNDRKGNDKGFGINDRGFSGNDRNFGRNSSREDQRGGRDTNQREGRDRRGLGFSNRRDNFGKGGVRDRQNDRNRGDRFDRQTRKPTQEQINKELNRRDVYPNTRWNLILKDSRPPLVGKRAKKVNNKIQKVIEKKRAIAAGEVPLEDLPFSEKVDKMFEMAQKAEIPKLLPGSAKRRLNNIKKKNDADITSDERKFLAYCDYVNVKRQKYFDEKKKREEEEAKLKAENPSVNQEPMDQEPSQS
ncbi:unnamed protein product [Chironomus riparius]|uniref:YLPM1-like spectrin repeat domain-containing protein n=1 Tax=Chironomus riparius TaxID=315576 RepID=A0A9N9WTL8_9DIPT|nr:unnamed protein product [Chironomus riparius]